MSRKHWMMTYVCLSPALVTNAYTFVYVQNAAALDKKPGVYCNCQIIDYMCGAIGKWKALNRKGSKDVYEFTECPNCYPLPLPLPLPLTLCVYQTTKDLEGLVLMSYSIQCTMVVFFSIHEQRQ
ncbi:protein PHOTOSYSTEM I ASSEMBLY 2, chloroplastic-like isoform X2 [Raphanus sativus]|uniref:Protein PHOTOSYSTEM I ASSEMBLY 2, chloroplastic-like isoform X2 n=1 Tax=Raphanus sativus TaxID=3726 RepID=A0A9W3DGX6_RAPSA|nr:protein PHOTOSYSTEM I ASSEMBLY 2, chloroplastic-like isoform X2 [Raphanus sativus]